MLVLGLGLGIQKETNVISNGVPPVEEFNILTETGDDLITETGDEIVTEDAP